MWENLKSKSKINLSAFTDRNWYCEKRNKWYQLNHCDKIMLLNTSAQIMIDLK